MSIAKLKALEKALLRAKESRKKAEEKACQRGYFALQDKIKL